LFNIAEVRYITSINNIFRCFHIFIISGDLNYIQLVIKAIEKLAFQVISLMVEG